MVAAIRPKSNGSSTTGMKKSVVATRAWSRRSAARPRRRRRSRCRPAGRRTAPAAGMPGEKLAQHRRAPACSRSRRHGRARSAEGWERSWRPISAVVDRFVQSAPSFKTRSGRGLSRPAPAHKAKPSKADRHHRPSRGFGHRASGDRLYDDRTITKSLAVDARANGQDEFTYETSRPLIVWAASRGVILTNEVPPC